MSAINDNGFVIAFDTFMTPSAQATCDIFLPLAAAAEREGVVQTITALAGHDGSENESS